MRNILFLLLSLAVLPLSAGGVKLKLGEHYQIRCLCWPAGCVAPSASNPEALVYAHGRTDNSWWTVTKDLDGYYLIRNVKTGRYMTYDGQRTADRRYMRLSRTDYNDASRWKIYPGRTGLIICHKLHIDHLLDVRRDSYIVGTYRNSSSIATDNGRFFLVDGKGRVVTDVDGTEVKLPTECFDSSSGSRGMPAQARKQVRVPGRLEFTVNGHKPVYDKKAGLYLYPLPERTGSEFTAQLAAAERSGLRLFVNGKAATRNGRCSFAQPEDGRVFRLALASDSDTVAVARLTFTYLPIVEISGSGIGKSHFTAGTFRLHDPDNPQADSLTDARLRYRGDYATFMNKKSFAVKLTDGAGKASDRKLLGMRSDNYWILDAMAVDHARMRNRVAMDLWMDFAAAPYYAPSRRNLNGVRGRLVEVFWNGSYQGVYNLSERVDRKQMGLARSDGRKVKGCLYKSNTWSAWTLMGSSRTAGRPAGIRPPQYDNRGGSWNGWDAKYPKAESGRQTEWKPLYDAADLVSRADDRTFAREVAERFDLPVVRDYWLFIELLFAVDNSGKNMYWAVGDQSRDPRLTPAPWDLDGTFGRSWDGHRSECAAGNDYRSYLRRQWKMNALFERLETAGVDGWKTKLSERYRSLRRTHFDPDRLMKRFEDYFRLLERSGATARERQRWDNANGVYLNFRSEKEYLRNWIKQRVATLDRQYGY